MSSAGYAIRCWAPEHHPPAPLTPAGAGPIVWRKNPEGFGRSSRRQPSALLQSAMWRWVMAPGVADVRRDDIFPAHLRKRRTARVCWAGVPLVALLVCGCGGDSNDEAVGSNPPAPAPSPSPSPAPAPTPSPEPGPTPTPVPGPPPAPSPEPAPIPGPPPGPAMAIDSGVLATAICTSTQSIHGQPRVLAGVPGRPDLGYATASQNCTADSVPVYFLSSGSFQGMPDDLYTRTWTLGPT